MKPGFNLFKHCKHGGSWIFKFDAIQPFKGLKRIKNLFKRLQATQDLFNVVQGFKMAAGLILTF
jgi:hypothetical protein